MIIHIVSLLIQQVDDKFQRIFDFHYPLLIALFQTGNEKEYPFIFDLFISNFEYFINTFNFVAFFNVIFHVNVSTIIIHYIFVGRSGK